MQTHPSLRRRGFTLLELLVTLTMIGLVAMMSMPRAGAMMTQWRVNRAAQAYGEELQSAFAIVGRDRRPVRIELKKDSMQLRITNRAGTLVYRKRDIGKWSAYKLDSANVQASTLILEVFPPGLAADSLSVTISRDGKFRRVRMLRGGLVQICSNPATVNAVCVPA
jgi:prepilin-type N-terminal cleavage/methylation domain-containing protein